MNDNTGKRCEKCQQGHYYERSINDDLDRVLHCDKCNHQVSRWEHDAATENCGCVRDNNGKHYTLCNYHDRLNVQVYSMVGAESL